MDAIKLSIINELHSLDSTDIRAFVLKNSLKLTPEQLIWAANYLHFKSKIKDKIPAWSHIRTLEPLPALSIEQSSSQITAEFKAALIPGDSLLDLTGGMAIDTYFFAKKFKQVTYIEQQGELTNIARHNLGELHVNNVEIINENAENFLQKSNQRYDLIYLDPARRDAQGGKVFFIQDCSPDVASILPELFKKTENILIKYAPMLDIKAALAALKTVYKVVVVAVDNDVKEVLYWLCKTETEPIIEAINLSKENQPPLRSDFTEEFGTEVNFNEPKNYLYEPNAAVLKAGLFKTVAQRHKLHKLAPNTHLYTSDKLTEEFPGRKFRIEKTEKFNKKLLRKELKGSYANVSCRNFPLKPEQLKQLLNFKDGGEKYVFFSQNYLNEKIVIFTTKISDQNLEPES